MVNPPRGIAFAFDVDGVILRGKEPLDGARHTLAVLQKNQIPFIFLTNSGGLTEQAHVDRLGLRLGLKFDKQQLIQSHTPFQDLVPLYRKQTILVIGGHGNQIRDLAHAYGFERVVTSSDLLHEHEHIHPFPEMTGEHHGAHGRRPVRHNHVEGLPNGTSALANCSSPTNGAPHHDLEIAAILIWSCPRDWCLDIQVMTDLLLSHRGRLGTVSALNGDPALPNHGYQQDGQPPVYLCNPDLQWATAHAQPRLAQGAFREALGGVFRALSHGRAELLLTTCGKPTASTFAYGERELHAWQARLHGGEANGCRPDGRGGEGHNGVGDALASPPISTVYMVGDNPESDVCGTNAHRSKFGATWRSVLVETGIHVAGTKPAHEPHHVAPTIKEAVRWALEQEGVALEGL